MTHSRRRNARLLALLVTLVMLLVSCGGDSGGGDDSSGSDDSPEPEEAQEEIESPERGGSVTMGLEAETGDGWCLPEAQLAISGIMVARTIYDTLTAPNADGDYVPYLAESVEPSEDFKTWTIKVREGIKFHDGSDLNAEVVKNNIDAFRGQYEGRNALLFLFVLSNIDTVEATDDMTVTVTTKVPWVALPAFLHASGRFGIVAQAQLDDGDGCTTNLIGTGPFVLDHWTENQEFVANANPDYWQEAPDGEPYPYLEQITFVPITDAEQRVNAVESGDVDMIHASGAVDFLTLNDLADAGAVKNRDSDQFPEVYFVQINSQEAMEGEPPNPLSDVRVRQAMAMATDREDYKEVINRGLFTLASGPYGPGATGYLEDSGYPTYDLEGAKALLAEYEQDVGPIRPISYQTVPGAQSLEVANYIQQTLSALGIQVQQSTIEQAELIANAISGDFDIMGFRNYPGGDPDELYVWWKSDSPANFGRINDPEIDRLLDEGRSEPDPEKRATIYEDVNKQFASQVWSQWSNWTTWRISSRPEVFGYSLATLPKLPDGSDPFPGLATGFPTMGLWVTGS